jgi:cation-transporting ATPase 13A3/4/5
MKRAEAESDLDFVGFIIFENKLKPSTAGVLETLEAANIRKLMCTGDNILTAISVGRESGLLHSTAHCFVPHFVEGHPTDPKATLLWESIDNPMFRLDSKTLMPLPPPVQSDASLPYDVSNLQNYNIAVSGDVFRWMIDYAPNDVVNKMLLKGQIFARMSPDEKHELVEASVAAPFTSRVFDITCVPEVIREGRAALVTSFSCFKYMSLYSAIQFTSVSFLYASASNLGDFQVCIED